MPKKCREWLWSSVHFLDAPVTDCRFDKPARLLPGPLVNFDVKHVRKKDKKILEKKRRVGETRTQSSIEGSVQTFRSIIQLDEDHRTSVACILTPQSRHWKKYVFFAFVPCHHCLRCLLQQVALVPCHRACVPTK
jgi:hypothetical protein